MKNAKRLAMALFFLINTNHSFTQIVTTFAGSGILGSIDSIGTEASFNKPNSICRDSLGNFYVSDGENHKIRKITPEGVVTTFVGSGIIGSSNGNGDSASFYNPAGLCFDPSGNLYVADFANHLIRKITPEGVVTTFAGSGNLGSTNGMGTAAWFNYPSDVCSDSEGNIYVCDTNNKKVRKITPEGLVTTFAGTGFNGSSDGAGTTASFSNPWGMCVDAEDNIYIADHYNNKVRKITPEAIVTTFAGSGLPGSADGDASSASFNLLTGLDSDAEGNIYVADHGNHKVRKISPSGTVSTFAGTGVAGSTDGIGSEASFNSLMDVYYTPGNIYVADQVNHKIRKISFCEPQITVDVISSCDSYTWIDGNTYYSSTDTASFTFLDTTGCDSIILLNLTINQSTSNIDFQSACFSYTWIDGNTYNESNNTATYTFINTLGCDSVVNLDLSITNVDVSVFSNGISLTSNAIGANYQWFYCDTGYLIAGADEQTYIPNENGVYAVIITQNSCIDTSSCYMVSSVEIIENAPLDRIKISPNPSNGLVNIDFKDPSQITLKVFSTIGKLIFEDQITDANYQFELKGESGMYFLELSSKNEKQIYKVLKN